MPLRPCADALRIPLAPRACASGWRCFPVWCRDRALDAGLRQGGVADGFLTRRATLSSVVAPFPMSDRNAVRLVQAWAAPEYDPAGLAGHPRQARLMTAATRADMSVLKTREVPRHKSLQVLAHHVRGAELVHDHAGDGFL